MPKIYEYFGIMFLINTKDHLPIHVHAKSGNKESIIEIIQDEKGNVTRVRKRRLSASDSKEKQLSDKDLSNAIVLVNSKAEEIVQYWKLVRKGTFKQKPLVITRKLK